MPSVGNSKSPVDNDRDATINSGSEIEKQQSLKGEQQIKIEEKIRSSIQGQSSPLGANAIGSTLSFIDDGSKKS